MELNETAAVLAMIAALDRRMAFSQSDAVAWQAVIGDNTFNDCREAVIRHYQESPHSITPSDIIKAVRAMRARRHEGIAVPVPPVDPDNVQACIAWQTEWSRAIGDGLTEKDAYDRATRLTLLTPVEISRD